MIFSIWDWTLLTRGSVSGGLPLEYFSYSLRWRLNVFFLFGTPSGNRGCELWTQQQMFLISHETKPEHFRLQRPWVRESGTAALIWQTRPDVNASQSWPRAPLRKLRSDTENKFAFFPFTGTQLLLVH